MKPLFFAIAILATFFTNVANAQMVALKQFWNGERADNFLTTDTQVGGYDFVRDEGFASSTAGAGLKPLVLLWNNKNDNFTTGTSSRVSYAKGVGYIEVRTICYVWENPGAGLIPLKLFWSADRIDNYTTASADGERDALGAGYIFAGIEGYIRSSQQSSSSSQAETITLRNITETLCPYKLVGGDREFDGHGPNVNCSVQLSIGDNERAIYADVTFSAKETVSDWSEVRGNWRVKVYDAPGGRRIRSINSATSSSTQFKSGAAGFQLLVPGRDVAAGINQIFDALQSQMLRNMLSQYGIDINNAVQVGRFLTSYINNGNQVYTVPSLNGMAVRTFSIVGDTGGPDISDDDNCNDDTRIERIEFNPLNVTFY